jgi:phi LC3 family holin
MLTLNLNSRFRNKAFLLAMVAAVVLLIKQLGFADFIPANYNDIITTILSILTMLGIVVDTSTPGVSDNAANTETTVQAVQEDIDVAAASAQPEVDTTAVLQENETLKAQLAQIQAAMPGVTQAAAQ